MNLFLSIVIPAYNEERRLPRAVKEIAAFVKGKGGFEIIVVDDGSKDGTATVVRELAKAQPELHLISYQPNRGKGCAVKEGMLAAQGRYVLFADADQSTPIGELDKLLVKLECGRCDIAIGSRRVPGAQVEQAQSWLRGLASKVFWQLVRLMAVRGVADTQCGFKCMTREAAQRIFPKVTTNTPIFDVEMLIVAAQEGLRVAEVPVRWVHDSDTRISYNFSRAVRTWYELLRIRRAHGVCSAVRIKT
jgi:dolichyl-phosphate beta-glucosyltransferase